jgi:cytochrome c oxidase subunit IV
MDEKQFEKTPTGHLHENKEGTDHGHDVDHGAGYGTYILIWLALIGLTAITVTIAGINVGGLALVVAMVIATTKTTLVMNYFMHVKFDSLTFKVFIAVCVIIFITMIGLTFFDLIYRDPLL